MSDPIEIGKETLAAQPFSLHDALLPKAEGLTPADIDAIRCAALTVYSRVAGAVYVGVNLDPADVAGVSWAVAEFARDSLVKAVLDGRAHVAEDSGQR